MQHLVSVYRPASLKTHSNRLTSETCAVVLMIVPQKVIRFSLTLQLNYINKTATMVCDERLDETHGSLCNCLTFKTDLRE